MHLRAMFCVLCRVDSQPDMHEHPLSGVGYALLALSG
jgi:hypothetical protein